MFSHIQNKTLVTLSEDEFEQICSGIQVYQKVTDFQQLQYVQAFQLIFSKTVENKSVRVKTNKSICKEGFKYLEFSKSTVQTTALENISSQSLWGFLPFFLNQNDNITERKFQHQKRLENTRNVIRVITMQRNRKLGFNFLAQMTQFVSRIL